MYLANFTEDRDKKLNLKNQSDSAINITNYLKHRGEHHTTYRIYYPSLKIIESIINNKALFARNNEYEDLDDLANISDSSDGFTKFVICFTFSLSENVAMWKIYKSKNNDNGMIKYSKDILHKIVQANKDQIEIGQWENKEFKGVGFIKSYNQESFGITISDVLYTDKIKKKKWKDKTLEEDLKTYIKRGDESTEISNIASSIPKYIMKHNAWCFENETRLIVSIKNDLLNDKNVTAVKLVLPDDVIKTIKKDKIYISPFGINSSKLSDCILHFSDLAGKVAMCKEKT